MIFLKAIVLCLALANLGYFLWSQGGGKSQAVAAPPAGTLKLVSEVSESERSAATGGADLAGGSSADVPSGAPMTAAAPSAPRCITVGPFKDVSEASHAASALRVRGYDPRQRVLEGDVWAGVWVYLPMPSTPAAGEHMIAKLRGAGIDEALEMPGPADGSVVSLGLFSEQKRAQARVAQAQALGFSPAIADRKRTGNVYWVDIDLKANDAALNPADLQAETGHISRLEVKTCPAT